MFAHVFDPADGAAGPQCDRTNRDVLGHQPGLAAEPAADIGRDHAELADLKAERLGESEPQEVGDLRGHMDHELVGARIPVREHRPAFHRHRRLPVHAIATGQDHRHPAHRFDIATAERRSDVDVVAPGLVDQGRRIAARDQRLDHRRQRFQIGNHAPGEVLGRCPRIAQTGGHRLTGKPHLVARQRPVIGRLETGDVRHHANWLDLRQVLGQENARATVFGPGDPAHPRVADRAAEEGDLPGAGNLDVGDVAAAAVQEASVLLARQARADPLCAVCGTDHRPALPTSPRHLVMCREHSDLTGICTR